MKILTCILLSIVCLSANCENLTDYPFLVEVSYNVNKQEFVKLVDHVLMTKPKEELNQQMTTKEFLDFTKLTNMTLEVFKKIVDELNLDEGFDRHRFEHAINTLNISVIDIYQKFIMTFPVANPNVFQYLNLNMLNMLWEANLGNNTAMISLLMNGTYHKENVKNALEAAGITENQLFDFARPLVIEKVVNLNLSDLLTSLERFKNEPVAKILQIQNITENNYSNEKIRVMVKDFEETMAKNGTLGVYVNPKKILTHIEVYGKSHMFSKFANIQVENYLHQPFKPSDVERKIGYAVIETGISSPKYIPIVERYNPALFNDCYYLTGFFNENITKVNKPNVMKDGGGLIIPKNNITRFRKGSPLICNNTLYGLASYERREEIYFSYLVASSNLLYSNVFLVTLSLFSLITVKLYL